MNNILSNYSKKSIKVYQISFLILGIIISAVSLFLPYTSLRYTMLATGVTISLGSILTALICPIYKGSFYFAMGTFIGLMVSLAPAILLRTRAVRFDNFWPWIIILGWASGGYLSVRDTVIKGDEILDSPLATGMAMVGVFFAFIVSLLILSLLISLIFDIFSISTSFLYSVIISFIIVNVTVVEYLSRKIFSKDFEGLEYTPHVRGVFGSFLGGITGLICSFFVVYFYDSSTDILTENFLLVSYPGTTAGVLLGFFIGYQIEKTQSLTQKINIKS